MTNKIIGIQGDKLDKINISSDTSIFLAHEAQKLGSVSYTHLTLPTTPYV